MSRGEQLEALWRELLRALQPITVCLTAQKLSRRAILESVQNMRCVLDKIERLVK